MSKKKDYRVTMRATVDVEFDLEAKDEKDAECKLWQFYPLPSGQESIGYYVNEQDEDVRDDSETYYEFVNFEPEEIKEIIELDPELDETETKFETKGIENGN